LLLLLGLPSLINLFLRERERESLILNLFNPDC